MKPTTEEEVARIIKEMKKEALNPKIDPKIEKEGLNRLTWLFVKGAPAPMLVRVANLQRQFKNEVALDESNVENPEERKRKLATYIS